MSLDALLLRIDRVAAGRARDVRMPPERLADPRLHRDWRAIRWILTAEIAIGLAAIVVAAVLTARGELDHPMVWFRSLVVLGLTLGLGYFALRAEQRWWWAYSRLRLFSRIFPIVTLVVAAIPGLYPLWMTIEQIVFSLLMIGIGDLLTTDRMRDAYRREQRGGGKNAAS
ncbi:hypothetical protein [Agrococcus jejuensis]|uniref:Uncharacterized protein n=1 Tax=Agrococcus jejuensis TaxID=399736 RepID=A0A1G8AHA8_9MICO|nr:hypothetical protein [Agrococcus jejuensis]SDH20395.1 hypothetical protein SAMN04489720_0386 [Agrococcus jejuensis]